MDITLTRRLPYCVIREWVSYGRQLPMADQDLMQEPRLEVLC